LPNGSASMTDFFASSLSVRVDPCPVCGGMVETILFDLHVIDTPHALPCDHPVTPRYVWDDEEGVRRIQLGHSLMALMLHCPHLDGMERCARCVDLETALSLLQAFTGPRVGVDRHEIENTYNAKQLLAKYGR